MNQPYVCNDAEFLSNVDGIGAFPHLLRLLARGDPVDLDELAMIAGPPADALSQVLRAQPGAEWNSEGRLVGFGLTPRPTDFQFSVAGKRLYTWCASDSLFFTVILGEHTVAESTCPTTGVPIRLEIAPGEVTSVVPSGTVVSQRHRRDLVGSLRSDICDHGHFFASASAAAEWLADHHDGQVSSIADAFAECRTACEELGWLPSEVPNP